MLEDGWEPIAIRTAPEAEADDAPPSGVRRRVRHLSVATDPIIGPGPEAHDEVDVTLDGAGNVRRLQLVGQERCLSTRDGLHSAATLAQGKRAEQGELRAYVENVRRFNRRQKHRQRLGKRLLDETAFYEFLGLTPSPSSGAASPTTLGSDSA